MITSLSLRNFQKHRDLDLQFQAGLNLIVGKNWAGKSTVQRAILYALGGVSLVPVKAARLVTVGESKMLVTLEFDGYRIIRGLARAVLERIDTGEILASGQTAVTEEVERILGISTKDFLAFRVARQNEAGALLTLGSAKLAEHINTVTGVDTIDLVLEKAKAQQSEMAWSTGRQSELEAQLAGQESLREGLLQRLLEGQPQVDLLEQEHRQMEELAKQASLRAGKLREEHQRGELASSTRASLEETRASLVAAYEALQPPLEEGAVGPDVEGLRRQLSEASHKQQWARKVAAERALTEQHLAVAVQKQSAAQAVLDATGCPDLEALQAESDKAGAHLATISSETRQAEKASMGSTCPTCHRPYDEHCDPELLRRIAAELQLQEQVAQNISTQALRELGQARLCWKERGSQEAVLQEAVADEQRLRRQLEGLVCEAPPSEADMAVLNQAYCQGLELQNAMTAFEANRKILVAQLDEVRDRLIAAPSIEVYPSYEEVTQATVEAESARLAADQQWRKAHELRSEMQSAQAQMLSCEGRLTTLQRQLEEVRLELARSADLSELSKYLKANRDRFTAEVWASLLGLAGDFISRATQGDVTELRRSADGEFLYVEGGQEMPVELASGMLSAILGTALKLALGSALGGAADFLLFDEVSAAGRDDVSLLVTGLLRDAGAQVILISHRAADAVVADHVVEL